jgi:membrane protein implicated in regulation of membrane protease activity
MKWDVPGVPASQHPVRDSMIIYGVLAIVIVAISGLTGGGWTRAVVVAAAFFVGASAWSWWRSRRRLEQERGR